MVDLNDPEFSDEKAFEATVDWVIEDLKNMRLADLVHPKWRDQVHST